MAQYIASFPFRHAYLKKLLRRGDIRITSRHDTLQCQPTSFTQGGQARETKLAKRRGREGRKWPSKCVQWKGANMPNGKKRPWSSKRGDYGQAREANTAKEGRRSKSSEGSEHGQGMKPNMANRGK